MGSSHESRSRRDRLVEEDTDDRSRWRDTSHKKPVSLSRERESRRPSSRDRGREGDRRDGGDELRKQEFNRNRHKNAASDSTGRASDRRSSSPRQRNAHVDRRGSTDTERTSSDNRGHRNSMHKRRMSRSPSPNRVRHKKTRSDRSRSPLRREPSLDRDQPPLRYKPRSRSNSPAFKHRKDRRDDDYYDSDHRRRQSPSKDRHSNSLRHRSPPADPHAPPRLRKGGSPRQSRSPSQLLRHARSPRELFPDRPDPHAASPRPDKRVASPSKSRTGNQDEFPRSRRRSPRPDREPDTSPANGLRRPGQSDRNDDNMTRSRRNSPSKIDSFRPESSSDLPRKIRKTQESFQSDEPRPIPSYVSESDRSSHDLSHRRRADRHDPGSPRRAEPDPYFTPQLNGQQYSAPQPQYRTNREWQHAEIQYPPGHDLYKPPSNSQPPVTNNYPPASGPPYRPPDRRQPGGPLKYAGRGGQHQWPARGRGGGQFGKRGAWESATDSPYASKNHHPPPPLLDEPMEDAESLFRPPEALRVEDESKKERQGAFVHNHPPSGPKAEHGGSNPGSKFSFAFKSKSSAPPKNERSRPMETSSTLLVDAKRAKPRHEALPPPPPPPPLQRPKKLKPKKILPDEFFDSSSVYYRKPGNASVIGSGTYGKVFKAIHVYTKEMVALKKIRMEGERDGFPVTAIREIKLLQSLKHPNIVSLLEVMVEKNDCFMVFEYLSHDLTGILNHPSFRLELSHKKHFSQQIFEGLNYLHTRGVLHRDIKAANILISRDGVLKLADFGLARFFAKHHKVDYTNRVITIWYRSPELLLGETQYGPAVDIWSAACVLIEIFTKHAIFPGNGGEINQLDVIYNVLGTPKRSDWPGLVDMAWYELMRPASEKPNVFADKYREKLSPEAFHLIESMFHYDPARRPSAAAVLQHPYFTEEEPAVHRATGLRDLEGDWHEFESKALRRENEKRKAAAANNHRREAEQRDAVEDRKRPIETDEQRETPAHKVVRVA